jgi:hypothetical protein
MKSFWHDPGLRASIKLGLHRSLGGNDGVHCVWSQIDLTGPGDRSGIDKGLVEERCVGERGKNAGELIAFQAHASGQSVLKSDEQVIARLRLYFDDVPVREVTPFCADSNDRRF